MDFVKLDMNDLFQNILSESVFSLNSKVSDPSNEQSCLLKTLFSLYNALWHLLSTYSTDVYETIHLSSYICTTSIGMRTAQYASTSHWPAQYVSTSVWMRTAQYTPTSIWMSRAQCTSINFNDDSAIHVYLFEWEQCNTHLSLQKITFHVLSWHHRSAGTLHPSGGCCTLIFTPNPRIDTKSDCVHAPTKTLM